MTGPDRTGRDQTSRDRTGRTGWERARRTRRLDGRIALVTGSSSGIGAALAERLVRAGATVLITGRDPRRLEAVGGRLAALAGRTGAVVALPVDLADAAGPGRLADQALDHAGRVDILINNAGVGYAGGFAGMPPERIDEVLAVDLRSPIALTRALLPDMRERGGGHVGFVTSIAGRTGVRGEAVYAAAKAGLDVFAESLRLELAGTGVTVGVVVPGVVDTPFFARRGRPYERRVPRPLPPPRVADAVLSTLLRARAEAYAPAWLRVPVAVRGVAPGLYRRLARRFG